MTIVAQPFKTHNLPNFSLGMNNQLSPDEIDDREFSDCENIEIDEFTAKSAAGYVGWDNDPQEGPFWGIYQFKSSDGTQRLLRQRQDTLEYDSDDAGTWVECTLPIAGSPAAQISLPQNQPTFITLDDTVLYSDGETYVLSSTDGITWIDRTGDPSLGTGLPASILISNGRNRILFLVKNTSKIWWSDINAPLTIQTSSWQYVNPNDGQSIVGGCLSTQGSSFLFKDKTIYEIDDITLGMISVNTIGDGYCSNHHSIVPTDDSVIFWSKGGEFKEIIGGVIRNIGGRISSTGRNWVGNTALITGVFYNGKVRISMPDHNLDTSEPYNSQEYVIYKKLQRNDPIQPYPITRNRRYFSCYGIELYQYPGEGIIEYNLYMGDSKTTTAGSPAATTSEFSYSNDYRDTGKTQGLNGEPQTCWLITKLFTEKVPFYVKKYKKIFYELNISQDTDIVISYRFDSYGQWVDVVDALTTTDIDWLFGDGSTGGFSEGYGFSEAGVWKEFVDLENSEKPRGIQFKITITSINDVTFIALAYIFMVKPRFK